MARIGVWPKRREDKAMAARNRLLPEGRVAGPMPWVIAIMMFLTVLAAAAGLGLSRGATRLGADLAGRATVQLIEADAQARAAGVSRAVALLRMTAGVDAVDPVDADTLAAQLRPWLGQDMATADLPVPALIDVTLARDAPPATLDRLRQALRRTVPNARVEPHAAFLAPLTRLLNAMALVAALLVLMMAGATGAVVVLAARGAHAGHRGTIDILHLMGATDVQIARLFQRRIALDALFGGALGFVAAAIVILLLGHQIVATESELLRAVALPAAGWALLLSLPIAGVGLATLTARLTVVRALRAQL